MTYTISGFLIFIFLILASVLVLLIPEKGRKLVPILLIGNYLLFIFFLNSQPVVELTPLFVLNEFGIFFLTITSVFAIFVTLINGHKTLASARNSILTAFLFIGAVFLVGSTEFITFYVGLELMSLMGYALVSISSFKYSKEAAIKYFIQGSIISAFFLLGIAFYFGATGGLGFKNFEILNQDFYTISIGLFVVVACFKLGVFPFHSWVPDVYSNVGRGTLANVFLLNKFVIGFSFITLVQFLLAECPIAIQNAFIQIIVTLAILSAFYGNIKGLAQKQYKRMIAYSSVAHSGYMILSLVLTVTEGYEFQLLYYLMFYSIAAAGAILIMNHFQDNGLITDDADSLKGVFYKDHLMGLLLTVFILSLSGFPLTSGFVVKYLLFINFFKEGLIYAGVALLISSVIGLGYYVRIISAIFADAGHGSHNEEMKPSLNMKILVTLMGILVVLGGIAPSLFMK